MNKKSLLNSAFVSYEEFMEILEGVIRLGLWTPRITPPSISIILHEIPSLSHQLLIIIFGNPKSTKLGPYIRYIESC